MSSSDFSDEGKKQARLFHPNIVSAYDFIYADGRSYLIMKFIEGESLDELLFRLQAPMPLPQVLAISTDVLHALEYAHTQNIVHRDIKPSNILIEKGERALVMDFGVAMVVGEKRVTRVGMAIGTPHYMSPEQILGSADIDRRADIYSFGCVFIRCLLARLRSRQLRAKTIPNSSFRTSTYGSSRCRRGNGIRIFLSTSSGRCCVVWRKKREIGLFHVRICLRPYQSSG